jgi:acyl-CoA reductase-like NAD-dependent aldehyde dehydrogenase
LGSVEVHLSIGGERREGRGALQACWNPATGVLLESYTAADEDDVSDAVVAARSALGPWSSGIGDSPASTLVGVASSVDQGSPLIAAAIVAETGMSPGDAAREVAAGVAALRAWAAQAQRPSEEWQSVGVVALVTTWTSPVAAPLWWIGAALAGGNTLVWAPSPHQAYSSAVLVDAMRSLPPGLLNVVHGDAIIVRELLGGGIDAAVAVGSAAEVGVHVRQALAAGIPFAADVAGHGAALVLEDADIDAAAQEIAAASVHVAGQRPGVTRVVAVEAPAAQRLTTALAEVLDSWMTGDPLENGSIAGPLIAAAAVHAADELINEAVAGGDTLRAGGRPTPALGERFYAPALLQMHRPSNGFLLARAPLLGVVVGRTEDELARAIARPLGCGVFTHDRDRAVRITRLARVLSTTHGSAPTGPTFHRLGLPRAVVRRDTASGSLREEASFEWQSQI